MSNGSVIDAEPTTEAQALACMRALIQLVSDAGVGNISETSMRLLTHPVDLRFMNQFGQGVTADAANRLVPGSTRVQNFEVARVEEHLCAIDRQLLALGGS